MPRLTILNHWQEPVDITINNGAAVTLPVWGRLERVLNGPVELHATATGSLRGFIRSDHTADGLVQSQSARSGRSRP
jgi:hypothetical protein